jgi:hypothetical protein
MPDGAVARVLKQDKLHDEITYYCDDDFGVRSVGAESFSAWVARDDLDGFPSDANALPKTFSRRWGVTDRARLVETIKGVADEIDILGDMAKHGVALTVVEQMEIDADRGRCFCFA